MNHRQLALALRQEIERALPGSESLTVKRWFCRLCAVRYLKANRLLPDTVPQIPLFAGCRTLLPEMLAPALALLETMPDAEWQGNPELCGWLYQYANLPERETALRGVRRHEKIAPEHVPAATQLFTPDWIVRCMVQNTLAPLCGALPEWEYVLPVPEADIPKIPPESLTLLDPCMGTGHILAYAFDALLALYLREGWAPETAAERILTHNLHGLDIDCAAAELGAFHAAAAF